MNKIKHMQQMIELHAADSNCDISELLTAVKSIVDKKLTSANIDKPSAYKVIACISEAIIESNYLETELSVIEDDCLIFRTNDLT